MTSQITKRIEFNGLIASIVCDWNMSPETMVKFDRKDWQVARRDFNYITRKLHLSNLRMQKVSYHVTLNLSQRT